MKWQVMLFVFAGLFSFDLSACAAEEPVQVCFQDKCFQAGVMTTPAERAQGLMGYESLQDDQGMLFVFDEPGEYGFWMKNMKFPIDIIWLGGNKEVVDIEADAPPCTEDPCGVYTPQAAAMYVLELPAGEAKKLGLEPGSILSF